MPTKISICIPSFKRPLQLQNLLRDLALQTLLPQQVIVVDNDAAGTARPVVEAMRQEQPPPPFELLYDVQPERNIALTRNRTVALAEGDWIAFVDDDESAPPTWLAEMMAAAAEYGGDGVLAPIICHLPDDAPDWMKAGSFYVRVPRVASGTVVPLNRLLFGNALLRASFVKAEPGPFDPAFGLTSGEDVDLLLRVIAKGAKVVWCDEAEVHEPVEPARMSLRYLQQRAFSGGQFYGRMKLLRRYGPLNFLQKLSFLLDSIGKLGLALVLTPLAFVNGRHRAAYWSIRASANLGKLSSFFGMTYKLYAKAPDASGTIPSSH